MRVLLPLLLLGGGLILPFVVLRRPWALRLWGKVRLVLVIYALVILLSAILGLVLRWNEIYG